MNTSAESSGVISKKSFDVMSLIGHGQSGTIVQLVRSRIDSKYYAMKTVDKWSLVERRNTGDSKAFSRAKAERNVYVDLAPPSNGHDENNSCPYFMKLYNTFQSNRYLYYILEYCPFDVLEYVNRFGPLPVEACKVFLAELSIAVGKLHAKGTVHRDIKTDNILISLSGHVRLSDFGLSKKLDSESNLRCESIVGFSLNIMPPEFFSETPYYGTAIDWFQVGICVYEAVTGMTPFQGSPLIKIDSPLFPPEWPDHVREDAVFTTLVEKLLHPDETKRLNSLCDVKRYMPDIDWDMVESNEPITITPFPEATHLVDEDGNMDFSSTPSEGFVVPRLLSADDEDDGDGVGKSENNKNDALYFKSFTFTRNM